MSAIIGFLSYKNKYPHSKLEAVGDALLTPVTTLLRRNSFVVLTNETPGLSDKKFFTIFMTFSCA